ncbi:hypothetical protein [Noviherbaspirillum sp. ST9]|uniref:hypothetical protein n=1 Tax=Noviherbaspirillum sp. ST9 TaxID=3401606 RepID=UPI003B58A146
MADENKDSTKPISSGVAPGPNEHRRDESALTTGSPYATGSATAASSATAGSATPGVGTTSGSTRDRLRESTADMASTAKSYAGDMASRAKDKGRTMFEQQKESALGQVGSVAQAIRSTATNLQGEGQDQTARYVQMIADQLENIGGRLRDKDLDTLFQDAQNLARRSPGTFIAGSVVAGFLLARFFKSSSDRQMAYGSYANEQRGVISAGEAGPYTGTATTASRTVGADGTPGNGATASGMNATNLGGSRL